MLELDVAEHRVEVRYHPANGVGLGRNLNLRVLRVVDALDVLQEILACKGNHALGHVFASKGHLRQGDDLLNRPLAGVVQLLLHLVAHTLGEVDSLRAHLGGLHAHLALASCIKGAVAAYLEVGDGGFCNHGLAKRDFLLLRLVVVRHNLVHAALLKINGRALRNNQVGVYLLLRFVEGIAQDDER